MEEFDNGDDFSDLYADVEVQASSAISAMHGLKEMTLEKDGKLGNAIDGFPQLPRKDDEFFENVNLVEKVNGFIEIDNAAINSGVRENVNGDDDGEGVEEHGCLIKLPIENGDIYEDGSVCETEDDLNIVRGDGNDGKYNNTEINGELGAATARKREGGEEHKEEEENGEGINGNEKSWNSGACHSQRKYTRPHPASFSSHFKGKSCVGTGLEDIGCGQLMDASPVIHRSGDSFCLARSRTVLDVNIHSLENKAWRHLRADMTKIFNFGCDEDGYKRCCSDVDRCQKQKIMLNRIQALKFPQHTKPKLQTEDNISKNRTSSHGRHSVDRNSDVAIQDLKAVRSDSETMTVAHQLVNYGPSKNGGFDIIGNGILHFSRTGEDDPPSLRRNDEGRVKIASGRHIPACDPVPLDLDKYGSVQISDSEEDNHHEMSDSGSDGGAAESVETSDDMNRRNSSSTSNKVSSRVKPRKFLGAQSHHGPGFSYFPSPSAAENIHRHSRKPSSGSESSVSDLRVSITCGYHPSKDSKSHGVKPNTRDGRCCERDNGPNEKELMWRRRSHHVPKLKPNLIDENASNSFGGNHLHDKYQSTISHTKQSARLSFYSTEKGMPYRKKGSGSFSPYFGGLFPDYHLGPALLQKQNWNISPSFGYEANWCDCHSMNRKLNFLKKKRTKLDYEAFEDNCYHNERRHDVHDTSPIKFEESMKLIPKNFYVMNGRGTQFREKGDGVQFRRRMIRDNMSTLHEYNNNFLREKYRRYMPSADWDGDHLDYRYDRNASRDIRKMESPRSGKRRCDNPRNRFDNSWCMENGYGGKRCIKHRPLSIRPHKESLASRRGQFHGAAGLKSDVVAIPVRQRDRESSLHPCNNFTFDSTKRLGYCGRVEDHLVRRRHHQQYTDTVNANKTIKNYHNQEHFVRKRYHQPPDILHLNEEVYKSRWQDGTGKMFPSKGSSYKCERISRNRRPNYGYALDCVAEIVDEGEVHKCKYKPMREDNCGNKFLESSNFMHPDNTVQINSSYRYSVDPCSVEGKEWQCTWQSSRRCSGAEGAVYYGRYDFMDWNDDREPEKFNALVDFKQNKEVLANEGKFNTEQFDKSGCSKFSGKHQNKFMDIEEGQIITEEINDKNSECMIASEDVTQINDAKHYKTHSDGDNVMEGIDDQRIQEVRVKMEKRRERFKDPITLISDSGEISKLLPYLEVETAESKLGRPARKRQWAGN